ncbi:MAG: phosphotransferase family protein [Pseudonocardiales bacterium]
MSVHAVNAAQRATEAAARASGIDATGLKPLRVGENVILLLPDARVVARVAPSVALLNSVRRELRVATWLAGAGLPAVRPVAMEPFVAGELVVSFWEYLPEVEATDLVTLADFLRKLHTLPVPQEFQLGPVRPFVRVAERIESAPALAEADRRFLRDIQVDLVAQWNQARFEIAPAVVHGDAHNENLVRSRDGRIVFLDLERVGVGQPEWDLTLTAVHHECGWHCATDYAAFIDTYGYDVRTSPAWPMLKAIRMLRMTTWLAAATAGDPTRADQLRFRMATLRDNTAPVGWDGF